MYRLFPIAIVAVLVTRSEIQAQNCGVDCLHQIFSVIHGTPPDYAELLSKCESGRDHNGHIQFARLAVVAREYGYKAEFRDFECTHDSLLTNAIVHIDSCHFAVANEKPGKTFQIWMRRGDTRVLSRPELRARVSRPVLVIEKQAVPGIAFVLFCAITLVAPVFWLRHRKVLT